VYRQCAALLIVTCLRSVAVAEPVASTTLTHDPSAAVRSPWLDQAPAKALEEKAPDDSRTPNGKLVSGLAVGGIYLGFSAWAYIAWYRNHPEKDQYDVGGDGYFGVNTYAGGADKLGHAWATMVLARGGTAALRAGGWNRTRSALVSALLSDSLFLAVEIKDYFYYEFSPGDFTFDTIGALAAIALDLSPRLDELLDFRVEYFPSRQYAHNLGGDSPCEKHMPGVPSCSRWNIAEDYSGERYLLALHLGALRPLRAQYDWTRYVDLSLGFDSRNYKPPPTLRPFIERKQQLFVGVSFNLQGLVDRLGSKESKLRKTWHGIFEVATPPMTLGVGVQRTTEHPKPGGA
jgi:hypothetical protein